MIENNRNNEQIYGRNDMIMLDQNNKIYGSLGIADKYVMKTEEGTRLILSNPKQGRFGDVLTEFNMYGRSEQKQYKGINLIPPNMKYGEFVEVSIPKGTKVFMITDGTSTKGGNLRFFNADKTEDMWFPIDEGEVTSTGTLRIDAKYVQYILSGGFESSKLCLGIGNEPIYEPYVGGKPSPSSEYPQEIKSVVNPTVKVTNEDGVEYQTVTLPYTLNAIPVSSGGNVTINGQQYIADYVDVEKGKLYRKVKRLNLKDVDDIRITYDCHSNGNCYLLFSIEGINKEQQPISNQYKGSVWTNESGYVYTPSSISIVFVDDRFTDRQTAIKLIQDTYVIYALSSQTEEDLSLEQIKFLESLSTYYPVTIVENNYNTWMKATYKSIESV